MKIAVKSLPLVLGKQLASFLAGSWRASTPAADITAEDLDRLTPLLLGSGVAGLGWWRIRDSHLRELPAAFELRQAYRFQSVHAAIHAQEIPEVFSLLRSAGIEPLLIKGWSSARLYPEAGLRPYGDMDLCVEPGQQSAVEALLKKPGTKPYWVDLIHKEVTELDDGSLRELYKRSQLVKLGEIEIRIPGPEDHLRISSLHFLKHGGRRPLWLCDIAAALECRPADFNWDIVLGNNHWRSEWIKSVIVLARELLGAEVGDVPETVRKVRLPGWFPPAVLKQWEKSCSIDDALPELMAETLRHPLRLPAALCQRWPDPITATIRLKRSLTRSPRLFSQVEDYALRAARFLTSVS